MHTKIVNPKNSTGQANYDNKGSAGRLSSYMAKEFDEGDLFLNQDRHDFTRQEVVDSIDRNVKGLRADEEKFHAFIVSPSSDELLHIDNDTDKLRQFAVEGMKAYVERFNWIASKDKRKFGTIAEIGVGERKPGSGKEMQYVILERNGEQRKYWGNSLHIEVNSQGLGVGDFVSLEDKGRETIRIPRQEKNGSVSFFEYERQGWEVNKSDATEMKAALAPTKREPPYTLDDFVWYAAIHKTREYTQADADLSRRIQNLKGLGVTVEQMATNLKHLLPEGSTGVTPSASMIKHFYHHGTVDAGTPKKGPQSHIHYIVSARTADMLHTVHPNRAGNFDRRAFYIDMEDRFLKGFDYPRENKTEHKFHYQHTRRMLESIRNKFALEQEYFDPDKLLDDYVESKDKAKFRANVRQFGRLMAKGVFVDNPSDFINGPGVDLRNPAARESVLKRGGAHKVVNALPSIVSAISPSYYEMPPPQKAKRSKRRRDRRGKDREGNTQER